MSRNKYPEETVARILDVSMRLFMEKGYDRTTIQDIVDGLNGLTKGAIYHHFKSKEEILDAALERADAASFARYRDICNDGRMTGLQKLQAMFDASAQSAQMDFVPTLGIERDPAKNGRLMGLMYRSIFEEVVPQYVQSIIEQGVADGSIVTDSPREMAEVMVLLANFWVSPLFSPLSAERMEARMDYYLNLVRSMGADLSSERVTGQLEQFRNSYDQCERIERGKRERVENEGRATS